MSIDTTINIILTIASTSGIAGLFWGIYQYRASRIKNRKEILFELIKEFDDPSNKMQLAKYILDGYYITPKNNWEQKKDPNYYSIVQLEKILRNSNNNPITDPGETAIRESFDTLLNFFDKLAYLLHIGLIKPEETLYFDYYIIKSVKQKSVTKYAKVYEFPLYRNIIKLLIEKQIQEKKIRIYYFIYWKIRHFIKNYIY